MDCIAFGTDTDGVEGSLGPTRPGSQAGPVLPDVPPSPSPSPQNLASRSVWTSPGLRSDDFGPLQNWTVEPPPAPVGFGNEKARCDVVVDDAAVCETKAVRWNQKQKQRASFILHERRGRSLSTRGIFWIFSFSHTNDRTLVSIMALFISSISF